MIITTRVTQKVGVKADIPNVNEIIGVALNIKKSKIPLNGLRHPREGRTCGWYLWAGEEEPSSDPNYFQPIHILHIIETFSEIIDYLALPPGFRFLLTPEYEDIWFDKNLLDLSS